MGPRPRTAQPGGAERAGPSVAASEWAKRPGLFHGLAPGDVAAIVATAQRRRVARHGVFFRQGAPASALHVLLQGRTKLVQTTPEGHQVVVRIVGAGDMFGGVAILGDAVYPATAEAIGASEALVWPSPVVARLIARYPALALNALRVLTHRLGELQDRYRELATERVEQRIARALVRLVRQAGRREAAGVLIDMALTRQDLAELTGTTLYTVSRILSGWQERGLVESGRTRVVIRDPHGIVAIAEDLPAHRTPAEPPGG
jgi:CRP-like cAMP-binding protein